MEHQESISWNKGSATVKTYKIFSFQFGKAQLIYYQCSSILNQSDVGIIKIPKYITHRTPGIFLEVGIFSLH